MRTRWVAVVLVVVVLGASAPGLGHPTDPRNHRTTGGPTAVGAALIVSQYSVVGLFEYYAHANGAVLAERGTTGPTNPPTTITGPWVAALFYPFTGSTNVLTFASRPEDKVRVSLTGGADIRFRLPTLGNVRLRLTPSSEAARPTSVALTTPGGHHGHTWDLSGVLAQGKRAYVSGTIRRAGTIYRIIELRLPGAVTTWLGDGSVFSIATN